MIYTLKNDPTKQPVVIEDIDPENGMPGRPVLVRCTGQGWYFGPAKHGGAAYMTTAWVSLDDLNEKAPEAEAAETFSGQKEFVSAPVV